MPSVSVRGSVKKKFQAACKAAGTTMKKSLDKLISEYIENQPSVREQGIRAIIYLQSLMGIQETRHDAACGWDAMSVQEQNDTLSAYLATQGLRPKVKVLSFNCDEIDGAEKVKALNLPGYEFMDMNRSNGKAIVRFKRLT